MQLQKRLLHRLTAAIDVGSMSLINRKGMKYLIIVWFMSCALLPVASAQSGLVQPLTDRATVQDLDWTRVQSDTGGHESGIKVVPTQSATPPELLVGAGIIGFTLGTTIGTGIGFAIDHDFRESWFPSLGTVAGGLAGGALGTPLAIHFANGRRGNLLLAGGASVAVTLAVIPLSKQDLSYLLLIPPAQITVSLAIERLTD